MTNAAVSQPAGPSPVAEEPVRIQVRRLHPDAPLPSYALAGDAGADLCTMVDVRLRPGERALLPTGLAIALPDGYAGFVHPRSGLAWRVGLGLVNAPGTIDSGYRGEIKVIVVNHDPDRDVELRRGDRIAQLVVQRVEQARFEVVEQLPDSARGAAGHGSTGGAGVLAEDVPGARVERAVRGTPAANGRLSAHDSPAGNDRAVGNGRGDDQ